MTPGADAPLTRNGPNGSTAVERAVASSNAIRNGRLMDGGVRSGDGGEDADPYVNRVTPADLC
jgi:hypothetical protein